MANFADRLLLAIDEKENPSVIGLDPRIGQIPGHIKQGALKDIGYDGRSAVAEAIYRFNKALIDAVYDLVLPHSSMRLATSVYNGS